MPKTTTAKKDAIKRKLCDLWGRILIKSIPTVEVFKELGYDYNNVSDREKVYRYTSQLQEDAEREWDKFCIEDGDKELIYKKWLDFCYLHKIPYIIFNNGMAISPRTYEEWEDILKMNCFRQLSGCGTSMKRMLDKDMSINGLPLKEILPSFDDFLKLIPEKIEMDVDKSETETIDVGIHDAYLDLKK